jgi:hypothetical protein
MVKKHMELRIENQPQLVVLVVLIAHGRNSKGQEQM